MSIQAAAIQRAIALCLEEDVQARGMGARLLYLLSHEGDYGTKADVVAASGVPALLALLEPKEEVGEEEQEVRELAASAIWGLVCGHPKNKLVVAAQGALTSMIKLLATCHRHLLSRRGRGVAKSAVLREGQLAALVVWSCCYGVPANQAASVSGGAVDLLVAILKLTQGADDAEVDEMIDEIRYSTTGALWHISSHPQCRGSLARAGVLDALRPIVEGRLPRQARPDTDDSGRADVQDDDRAVGSSEGVEPVRGGAEATGGGEGEASRGHARDTVLMGCLVVGNLSLGCVEGGLEEDGERAAALSGGVMEAVGSFVAEQSPTALTVSLLWTTVKPLVDLLGSPWAEVRGLGCLIIAVISQSSEHTSKFHTEGAVAPLQRLARAGEERERVLAAVCLENLGAPLGVADQLPAALQLRGWLRGLLLEDHEPVFAQHAVTWDAVHLLGEDDLKEMGLPVGVRRKLLASISHLHSSRPSDLCLICCERQRDACLAACGHVVCCFECGLCLRARGDPCPICRVPIAETARDILRIYRV